MSLFWQTVGRYALRHPAVSVLSALCVALGVGVYLAVAIANHSATAAFGASMDLVSGKSHLEVRGSAGELDESVFRLVRDAPGVAAASPVVEGYATVVGQPGEYLHLIGVDAFSSAPFGTSGLTADTGADASLLARAEEWLGQPGRVVLDARMAGRLGLNKGDELPVFIDGAAHRLTVFAIRNPGDATAERAGDHVAAMDIGWLQEILGKAGQLTSVQVILDDPGALWGAADELRGLLPGGAAVSTPAQRNAQVQQMLGAFRLNLTALSMVSALVGVFLIFNTTAASVVRRRREVGTLRALRASRTRVRWLFLGEALALGLVGVAVGIPLGIAVSGLLLGHVAGAISVHYILVKAGGVVLSAPHILIAAAYGMGAALLGAWLPADEAARGNAVECLAPGRQGAAKAGVPAGRLAVFGLGSVVLAGVVGLGSLGPLPPWCSFLACLSLIGGFALLVPSLAGWCTSLAARIARPGGSVLWTLSCQNLRRSLHRNALTIAALMAAVAMLVGVSVMVFSFRKTVGVWVESTMRADLFIGPAANQVLGHRTAMPDGMVEWFRARPEVKAAPTYQEMEMVSEEGRIFSLAVVDPDGTRASLEGPSPEDLARWEGGEGILVNGSFAHKFGVGAGDALDLRLPAGPAEFEVLGIYRDFAKDVGQVALPRDFYRAHGGGARPQSLVVYLADGAGADELVAAFRASEFSAEAMAIMSNRGLKELVFKVFDQTFAITYVLRSVAIFVAVVGVFLTLSTLVKERGRDIAVLRATGASRGQVCGAYMGEAAMVGLWGATIGVVCGLALAALLTWVVNRAFFGWTIDLSLPWWELVLVPIWMPVVAAAAGFWPALQAGRMELAPALRGE